jgi:hypothetical protein
MVQAAARRAASTLKTTPINGLEQRLSESYGSCVLTSPAQGLLAQLASVAMPGGRKYDADTGHRRQAYQIRACSFECPSSLGIS